MKIPMRSSATLLLFGVFALLGCASGGSLKTESVTAPGVELAVYASFGWQAVAEGPGVGNPPLSIADANIHNAIRTQLIQKGYREVESDPDLRVGFETAAYIAEKVSQPFRIGIGMGSFGGNVGGGVSTSVPVGPAGVETTQETRLTIRAVDPKSNTEVWVGTTTGDIKQGLDTDVVTEAVAKTLAEFPARPK